MTIRSLTVVLTADCNLRCEYCYLRRKRPGVLRWPDLSRSLDVLLPLRDDDFEICITGGEPLLAFPLLKRAVTRVERRCAGGRQVRWRLLTNGLLMTDEVLAFVDAHGFSVNLSLDGVAESQSARGRGTFDRLDSLLDQIRERYPRLWHRRLKIALTLSPQNVPWFAESIQYLLGKGVRTVAVAPAMGRAGWRPEQIDEMDAQFAKVSDALRRHYDRTALMPLSMFWKTRPDGRGERPEWLCFAYQGRSPVVDVDGRAYGCLLATASYQEQTSLPFRPAVAALRLERLQPGFSERPMEPVGRAPATDAFRFSGRRYSGYGRCAECQWLGRCQVCPLASSTEPGWDDPYRVPDFLCAFNQVRLAHRDRFPCQYDPLECLAEATAAHPHST